jgi:hypothetical protein
MPFEDFGTEQTIDSDRAYSGSRFSEVHDALFANPYQRVIYSGKPQSAPSIHVPICAGVMTEKVFVAFCIRTVCA